MSETRHYYTSTVASTGLSSSNSKETNPSSEPYLGFANLPKQVHRKSVKKGFEFTLMVVGEAGLGKSTLINALFCSQLYKNRKISPISIDQLPQTVEITSQQVEIEERGVKLKLTVVDTPGFGETIDGRECIKPICNYIDQQFERFLEYENGLNRKHVTDTRVHCCFYFVSPIGHGLRPIDVYALRQLQSKVNVIPIIAKADCLTRDELSRFKKRMLNELQKHKIQVYAIPDCDSDEEPEFKEQVQQLRAALPFAVSASLDTLDAIRKTHGRQYSWGTVEMENPLHSDFVKLRSLLVTHMQDLREMTNEAHYENYRSERLARRVSGSDVSVTSEPIEREQNKDRILQEKEEELRKMQQMIAQMQQQMHRQHIQDAN